MTDYKRLRMFTLVLTTTMAILMMFSGISQGAELDVRTYDLPKGADQLVHPDPDRACRLAIEAENGPAWGRIDIYQGFAKHKKLVGRLDFNLTTDERQVYEFEQGLRIGVFDINVDDGQLSVRVEQPTKPGVYPPSWAKTPASHLDIYPDAETKDPGGEAGMEEEGIRNAVLYAYGNPGSVVSHTSSAVKIIQIGDGPAPPSAMFNIVLGLADETLVSVESCNRPKHYMRVDGEEVRFLKYEDDVLFRKEATFRIVPGLADPSYASFESFAQPGRFLQQSGGLILVKPAADDASRKASTFQVKIVR